MQAGLSMLGEVPDFWRWVVNYPKLVGTVTLVLILVNTSGQAADSQQTWKRYQDEAWKFSLEIPESWTVERKFVNTGQPEHVIKKKVMFVGPAGPMVVLDLWTNDSALPLMDWFYLYGVKLLSAEAALPSKPNYRVGDREAIQITNPQHQSPPQLITIFAKDNLVFRLEYRVSDDWKSRPVIQHILDTFK